VLKEYRKEIDKKLSITYSSPSIKQQSSSPSKSSSDQSGNISERDLDEMNEK
jgi:hypothetical protein